MAGPVEEAGKVAAGAIEGLKNQPMMLALVLLQAFVLAAVLYNSINRQAAIDKQFHEVFEVLNKCMQGHIDTPSQP
jgi:hypothetical protein